MVRTFILIGIFVASFLPNTVIAQEQKKLHPDIEAYIHQYKALAMSEMQRTGVPAAIKLAQGIIETQAGKSDLVRRSNNHFGIKCKTDWSGDKVYHDDDARGECFRSYASADDSYRDHSDFLKRNARYSSLFQLEPTDYKGWSNGLKKAGYATNPKYPAMLIKAIEDYNLDLYSEIALGLKEDPEMLLASNLSILDGRTGGTIAQADNKHHHSNSERNSGRSTEKNTGGAANKPLQNNAHNQKTGANSSRTALPGTPATYPNGVFTIHGTKAIYAKAGTSLIALATQNNIPLAKLLEFNAITERNVLGTDQLLYLQKRKKKQGPAQIAQNL